MVSYHPGSQYNHSKYWYRYQLSEIVLQNILHIFRFGNRFLLRDGGVFPNLHRSQDLPLRSFPNRLEGALWLHICRNVCALLLLGLK